LLPEFRLIDIRFLRRGKNAPLRRFFFGHMMLYVFRKDFYFCFIKLVTGRLSYYVIDQHLSAIMFDLRLIKHFVDDAGRSTCRIKKLLFHHCMHNQLYTNISSDTLLLFLARCFELGE
jgi:hypothetical protein